MKRLAATAASIALAIPSPLVAQEIDFGDDASKYAKDGECDDSRFEGSGMTDTILLEEDIGHDATDCRVAYEQRRLTLKGVAQQPVGKGADVPISTIDFGNDGSGFANDGECDDVRFIGEAMATDLLVDSIGKDASDCKSAFEAGRIQLNAFYLDPTAENPIDFGSNTASFANDGECDDVRFTGEYSANVVYLAEDVGADANDCRAAMESGEASWQGKTATPNYGMLKTSPADAVAEAAEEAADD